MGQIGSVWVKLWTDRVWPMGGNSLYLATGLQATIRNRVTTVIDIASFANAVRSQTSGGKKAMK